MSLTFDFGQGSFKNWLIAETAFTVQNIPKIESIFAQGNGRFGIRAATEETYVEERRGMFVSGTFNRPQGEHEVPELPNAADLTGLAIYVNNCRFSLDTGRVIAYRRWLNLKEGELHRKIEWRSPEGDVIRLRIRRFVSLHDHHLFASQITIEPLRNGINITIRSGINGRVTNSGVQHFVGGEMRFFDRKIGLLHQATSESEIEFAHTVATNFFLNEQEVFPERELHIGRRDLSIIYRLDLPANQLLTIEKQANVFTSRDKDLGEPASIVDLKQIAKAHMETGSKRRYAVHFAAHRTAWHKFWQRHDIQIDSTNPFDQLAVRFALYHLRIMSPVHDDRMGIGAKGLTGEDYKGHSFWDTEIYILPFWMLTHPPIARSLLTYRYHLLPGAQAKARKHGYQGAMFPWESAWITDGEVTPEWGNVDHHTGEREKIWTGFLQQHISADIAYAVWQYFLATGDQDFMDAYGYEIIFSTADFWQSRLERQASKQQFHINNVIGPDEYKEHVHNNAFTNTMAGWNMQLALNLFSKLAQENPRLLAQLSKKQDLATICRSIRQKLPYFYVPGPNQQGLIPQDDTYLSLPELPDLQKFKNADSVLTIFKTYSMPELSQYQVSKQADLILLFLLFPSRYIPDLQQKNFDYYESRTLHDSSLSYAMHSLLAVRLGHQRLAYELWQKASQVDLSQNMGTSKGGIHAAAMGGIWQVVVAGFGGLQIQGDSLAISPDLPHAWQRLAYEFTYQGHHFKAIIDRGKLHVECLEMADGPQQITINGQSVELSIGPLPLLHDNQQAT